MSGVKKITLLSELEEGNLERGKTQGSLAHQQAFAVVQVRDDEVLYQGGKSVRGKKGAYLRDVTKVKSTGLATN